MPNQQLPHNMHNYVSRIVSILRECDVSRDNVSMYKQLQQ